MTRKRSEWRFGSGALFNLGVVLFGWMRWMVARDSVTYRSVIVAGIPGKLGVVVSPTDTSGGRTCNRKGTIPR